MLCYLHPNQDVADTPILQELLGLGSATSWVFDANLLVDYAQANSLLGGHLAIFCLDNQLSFTSLIN